ncbi:MAG: hypothetical protein ABI199_07495 [Bacteroidia bacterium]
MIKKKEILLCLLMAVCFSLYSVNGFSQVERKGKLISKISYNYGGSTGDSVVSFYLEIDYQNKSMLLYKTYDSTMQLKSKGYLNRLKYNLYDLDDNDFHYCNCVCGLSILSEDYKFFDPKCLFKDTSDLLGYDFYNLLHDSINIVYKTDGSIDSAKTHYFKIYQQKNGLYFSMIVGTYFIYNPSLSHVVEKVTNTHLFGDVFCIDTKKYNKQNKMIEEETKIYSNQHGTLSDVKTEFIKGKIISSKINFSDKIEYDYDSHGLLKAVEDTSKYW